MYAVRQVFKVISRVAQSCVIAVATCPCCCRVQAAEEGVGDKPAMF